MNHTRAVDKEVRLVSVDFLPRGSKNELFTKNQGKSCSFFLKVTIILNFFAEKEGLGQGPARFGHE